MTATNKGEDQGWREEESGQRPREGVAPFERLAGCTDWDAVQRMVGDGVALVGAERMCPALHAVVDGLERAAPEAVAPEGLRETREVIDQLVSGEACADDFASMVMASCSRGDAFVRSIAEPIIFEHLPELAEYYRTPWPKYGLPDASKPVDHFVAAKHARIDRERRALLMDALLEATLATVRRLGAPEERFAEQLAYVEDRVGNDWTENEASLFTDAADHALFPMTVTICGFPIELTIGNAPQGLLDGIVRDVEAAMVRIIREHLPEAAALVDRYASLPLRSEGA